MCDPLIKVSRIYNFCINSQLENNSKFKITLFIDHLNMANGEFGTQ